MRETLRVTATDVRRIVAACCSHYVLSKSLGQLKLPMSDDYPTAEELDQLAAKYEDMDDVDDEHVWTCFNRLINRALAVREEAG